MVEKMQEKSETQEGIDASYKIKSKLVVVCRNIQFFT